MLPYFTIGSVSFNTFTVVRVVACVAAVTLVWIQWKADPSLGKRRWRAAFFVMVVGLCAGTLGWRVWEVFRAEVLSQVVSDPFRLSQASAWYFAGFIMTLLGLALALRLVRVPVLKGLDLFVPCITLGHAIQRVGCFLAGDGCYGRATDLPWGMAFPNGSVPIDIPVHPTMLYEAILMAFLFIYLWKRRGTWPEGISFAICLVVVGTSIFLIHYIHLAPKVAWGLTEAQLFSLLLVPFGGWMLMKTLHGQRISLRGGSVTA